MKVGILGAGTIAGVMARTINGLKHPEITLYAVASRTQQKADAFARDHKVTKAYGSYEDMLADPAVDLVYIATPHSEHYRNIKACLRHHKAMLVEKSFTANVRQAREVLAEAEAQGTFITEAIWTRYMPSRKIIAEILSRGSLGRVHSIEANLSYPLSKKQRIVDPALAGGALLDIGVYPINFAMMFFGHELAAVSGTCLKGESGVDMIDHISLAFKDGKFAGLLADAWSPSARLGFIHGETGYLLVNNINNPDRIELYNKNHELVKTFDIPKQVTGYEYQLISCLSALKQGRLSCPEMSHQETIEVMEVMDKLRRDWGIHYPFEDEQIAL